MPTTRSVDNYPQYLIELEEEFAKKYGAKYASKYIEFIKDRYDCVGRVFLDKNIMWKARDDYSSIKNGNLLIYLCVGLGNVGKTTFMKNLLYFYDKSFRNKDVCWTFEETVNKIEELVVSDELYRAFLTDEPNDEAHPQSQSGKKFKEIVGQLRQQSPIWGLCSTDFKDIPATIIRKLAGLFYLNAQGHGYFIRNAPEYNEYPLDEFKKHYNKEGYKIFDSLIHKYSFLEFHTYAGCVLDYLDKDGQNEYTKLKKDNLKRSIKQYHSILKRGEGLDTFISEEQRLERNTKIKVYKTQGYNIMAISRLMGVNPKTIRKVLKEQDTDDHVGNHPHG